MTIESFIIFNKVNPETGLTIKQENLRQQHDIPLDTLVEINCDYSEYHGLRLFVARHERDCDGTPLYGLSFEKHEIISNWFLVFKEGVVNFAITGGFGKESLIVVKSA